MLVCLWLLQFSMNMASPLPLPRVLLLTGRPGIGKTTAVQRISELLSQEQEELRIAGFVTLEIREGGERRGFRLVDFAGHQQVIAHVNFPAAYSVGKYGVDVAAIDAACSAIEPDDPVADGRSLLLLAS